MSALAGASVQRVRAALAAQGIADRIVELAATARTAEDAAKACGVPVGAIVKSLLFEIEGAPVLAPVGHVPTVIDASLGRFERLLAAAGHPHCVFATSLDELAALTGGTVSDRIAVA